MSHERVTGNRQVYEAGEKYLAAHRAGHLRKKRDLVNALANKWYRLNVLYKIKNKQGRIVRFKPNIQQRDRFITGHTRDIILKARQLGFTTFEMVSALDECLFTSNFAAGCICHTLQDAKDIFDNKVKLAYQQLIRDDAWVELFTRIGLALPKAVSDRAGTYKFTNGSSIQVSTSYRGGTLQKLHVSEFGKICRKRPDHAQEIVTGAFEAVPIDGQITLESTAEGRSGYFFDYTQEARRILARGRRIGLLDWLFHFYPWWEDPSYSVDPTDVEIPSRLLVYFAELQSKYDINTSPGQQAWYAMKEKTLQDDMQREYPSTPEEAFSQSVKGAFYYVQMIDLRKRGGITKKVGWNRSLPVHTAWDLGMNDSMSIVFFQIVGRECHVIDYFERSGEGFEFYAGILKDRGYTYGKHYGPHDLAVREMGAAEGAARIDSAASFGINFEIVPRISNHMEGINAVRRFLPLCWFSEIVPSEIPDEDDQDVNADTVNQLDRLIDCLDNYRKEWDDRLGLYKSTPLHDWASHGAKAFETLARCGMLLQREPSTGHERTQNTQRGRSAWGAHT